MKQHQEEIYLLLASDSTLKGLLGGTSTDSKIYPMITAKFEAFPCITYMVRDGKFRTVPLNTQDIVLQLHVYSKTSKSEVEDIADRIRVLLNYYKDSTDKITYLKQIMDIDMPETDRALHGKVVQYQMWARK